MKDFWLCSIAGLFAAVFTSMGLGGGSILMIFLLSFLSVQQIAAQGINLVFFVPVAAVSLLFHVKNGFVKWRVALPAALAGLVGGGAGAWAATLIDEGFLRYAFAGFLILSGSLQLIQSFRKRKEEEDKDPDK